MPGEVNVFVELDPKPGKQKWKKLRWRIRHEWVTNKGQHKSATDVVDLEAALDEMDETSADVLDVLQALALQHARKKAKIDEEE